MTPEPELFWGVEAVPVRIKRLLTSETLISVGLIRKETFSALVLVEYQVVSSERGPPASIVYRLPDYQLTSRVDRPHKGYSKVDFHHTPSLCGGGTGYQDAHADT